MTAGTSHTAPEPDDLPDWAHLVRGLRTRFTTTSFAAGLELVNAFAEAAEAANHHPDLTLRYGQVDVLLFSHDVGEITERDHQLAARLSSIAKAQGAIAAPLNVSVLEIALDTANIAAIGPFWAAVLDVEFDGAEIRRHLADAVLWFQHTDPHTSPRQRFHLDVWLDRRAVEARIAAALAAGGRLVSDAGAPSFWVLADPDDHKVCICTSAGR